MSDKERIVNAIKQLKSEGVLDLDIEVAEHLGEILENAGIVESADNCDFDLIERYDNLIRSSLEEVFGKKIEAGYFVESIVRDVIRQFVTD